MSSHQIEAQNGHMPSSIVAMCEWRDHLMDGKAIEQIEAQFATGLHPDDWQKIRDAALTKEGSE